MRIILTVVGLSLIDKIDKLNEGVQIRGAKQRGGVFLADYTPEQGRQGITLLRDDLNGAQLTDGQPTDYAQFAWLNQQRRGAGFLVDLLCDLWRGDNTPSAKQKNSPAELASLSLLKPPLAAEDEVRFLYSDTVESAVCSAILTETLTRLSLTNDFGPKGLKVTQRLLQGIQMKDLDRLITLGIPTWATLIEEAQRDAAGAEEHVLLNITGGYKGVAPLSALMAFGLSNDKPIQVFYLYEDSNKLLSLPGSTLIQFDLSVFQRFASDWRKMPEGRLAESEYENVFTPVFIKQVLEKRPDLMERQDGWVQLTVTGRILWNVWRVRTQQ